MKVWKPLFHRIKSEFLSMEFKVFSKQNFSLSFIIVVCHPVDWLIDWYISNRLRSTSLGNRLWDGDVHEESYWEVKEVRLGRRWRRCCHNKVLELGWPFRMAPSWGKGVRLHIPTLHPTQSSYVCGLPMERWFFLRANPREPSPTHLPAAGGMNASILEGIDLDIEPFIKHSTKSLAALPTYSDIMQETCSSNILNVTTLNQDFLLKSAFYWGVKSDAGIVVSHMLPIYKK